MKILFCKKTRDITYLLSKSDVKELKRTEESTSILTAECEEFTFNITNSGRVSSEVYIRFVEPRNQQYLRYWTGLSDRAYEDLVNNGRCGTRWGDSSKLNIIIEEEL